MLFYKAAKKVSAGELYNQLFSITDDNVLAYEEDLLNGKTLQVLTTFSKLLDRTAAMISERALAILGDFAQDIFDVVGIGSVNSGDFVNESEKKRHVYMRKLKRELR